VKLSGRRRAVSQASCDVLSRILWRFIRALEPLKVARTWR